MASSSLLSSFFHRLLPLLPLLLSLLLLLSSPASASSPGLRHLKTVDWAEVTSVIEDFPNNHLYVRISDDAGMLYNHSVGIVTEESQLAVASASKWVSSSIIWDLIEQGALSLATTPQTFIPFWTSDPADARSRVTLAHTLAFTTGFIGDSTCIDEAAANQTECLWEIYSNTSSFLYEPGSTYYYGSNHMYIAKMIAEAATGLSWATIASNFFTKHSFASQTRYQFPSVSNPNIAGGLYISPAQYDLYLQGIYKKTLLLSSTIDSMETDQLLGVTIAYSPAAATYNTWHYAFGNWVQCPKFIFNDTLCNQVLHIRSSPGMFGFYPAIDRKLQYSLIIAVQTSSFVASYGLASDIMDIIENSPDVIVTTSTTSTSSTTTPTATATGTSTSTSTTTTTTTSTTTSTSISTSTSSSSTTTTETSSGTTTSPAPTSTSTSTPSSTPTTTSAANVLQSVPLLIFLTFLASLCFHF